ncbi:MAG: D-alanine--D-alanine ligase [Clostridiaceae bacterium]|nr:D-alanine--D-alanine ligase [Clostridiaceae bacterium]
MKNKKTVAVLFGGQSFEHEVSRVSAQSVIENLDKDKYDIIPIGITKEGKWIRYTGEYSDIGSGKWEAIALKELKDGPEASFAAISRGYPTIRDFFLEFDKNIDIVFPVLHGCNGEDGTIQGLLELAGIPYVGCGVLSSAVGMDKATSKILFESAGIPQGKYFLVLRSEINGNIRQIQKRTEETIGYPCFVKPSNCGSSVGVSKVNDSEELLKALLIAGKYDRRILIEEFINGREIECAVLGNDSPIASTVGEVVPCNEFYDYKAKYIDNASEIIIPAQLDDQTVQLIRNYAVEAFKALDCSGLARVDFFVEKVTGKVYINEINTMPGFTSISMYPKLWEACGIPYGELLDRLIDFAFTRFKENRRSYEREV